MNCPTSGDDWIANGPLNRGERLMQGEPENSLVTTRRRRWWQFSLSNMLLVTAIACLAVGWYRGRLASRQAMQRLEASHQEETHALHNIIEQQAARLREEILNGDVSRYGHPEFPTGAVVFRTTFVAYAQQATQFGAVIVDEQTVKLDENWRGGDMGVLHLYACKPIRNLHLVNAPITDDGLYYLRYLSGVRELHLDSTVVTDDGVSNLWPLRQLEVLFLSTPQVTDRGIEYLAVFPNLKQLVLEDTRATATGIGKLQSKRPELRILVRAAKDTPDDSR